MKQKEIIRILKKEGFEDTGQGKGSHVHMRKGEQITTIPQNHGKDLPKGTLKAIEIQTGIKLTK